MNPQRLIACLALVVSMGCALPAAAHDKNVLTVRDVVHCMKARMKADQRESYNDAFKVCKQQVDPSSRASDATTAMNGTPERPKT